MKVKFLVLFMGMIIPFLSIGQKCKAVVDEEDKFTKAKKILYGGQLVENIMWSDKNQVISLYFGTVNDSLFLQLQLTKIVNQEDVLKYDEAKEDMKTKKGAKLYLSLADGESIALTALYDSKLNKQKVLSTLNVIMMEGYGLTPEQVVKLSTTLITGIRIDFAEVSPLTAKVKSAKAEKMKAQFLCAKERFGY